MRNTWIKELGFGKGEIEEDLLACLGNVLYLLWHPTDSCSATTLNCIFLRDQFVFWHFHCFFHRRIYDQRKIDENENNGVLKKFCPHHLVRFMKGQWLQASLPKLVDLLRRAWTFKSDTWIWILALLLNQLCGLGQSLHLCWPVFLSTK